MDLIDEQHVAVFQFGQDRRQIAGSLESWAGSDLKVAAHLRRNDVRKRRLPEAWRTGEKQVVSRLSTASGGTEHDTEVALEFLLSDKLRERAGPKSWLVEQHGHVIGFFGGREQLFAGHGESLADLQLQTPDASRRRASFRRLLVSPSAGRSTKTA